MKRIYVMDEDGIQEYIPIQSQDKQISKSVQNHLKILQIQNLKMHY